MDPKNIREDIRSRLQTRLQEKQPDQSQRKDTIEFASSSIEDSLPEASVGQTLSLTPKRTGTPLAAIVRRTLAHSIALRLPWPELGSRYYTGDLLHVDYWDQDSTYSFDSKILVRDSAGRELEIAWPKKGRTSRRKRGRLYGPIPFGFTVIEAKHEDLVGQQVEDVKTLDLSLDGLRFETPLSLKLGDKLKIRLFLSEETCALSRVIRYEPVKGDLGPPFSVAVRFVEFKPEDNNRLMLFLAKTRAGKAEGGSFWVD